MYSLDRGESRLLARRSAVVLCERNDFFIEIVEIDILTAEISNLTVKK